MTSGRLVRVAGGLVLVVALVILSNGPLFVVARRIYDRPGFWEDPFIRPALEIVGRAGLVAGLIDLWRGPRRRSVVSLVIASAFAGLALWSTSWSVAPTLTWWRSLVYLGLVGFAWVLAGLSVDDLRDVLAVFSSVTVGASLAVIVWAPRIGIDPEGAWRGLYTGPNSLAPLCGLSVIAGMAWFAAGGLRRPWGVSLVGLGLFVLARTDSVTAMVALGLALVVSGSVTLCRRLWVEGHRRWARGVLITLVSVSVTAGIWLLPLLWRAPTLTRRRELWDLLWDRIVERPIAGHGFFAFWEVRSLLGPYQFRLAGSAHNSWVEVLLGLGAAGLVLFAAVTAVAVARPLLSAWRRPDASRWFPLAVVSFVLVEMLTESFVSWFSYMWVLVMTMAMAPVAVRPRAGAGEAADVR